MQYLPEKSTVGFPARLKRNEIRLRSLEKDTLTEVISNTGLATNVSPLASLKVWLRASDRNIKMYTARTTAANAYRLQDECIFYIGIMQRVDLLGNHYFVSS